jgi:hypothetical protein
VSGSVKQKIIKIDDVAFFMGVVRGSGYANDHTTFWEIPFDRENPGFVFCPHFAMTGFVQAVIFSE